MKTKIILATLLMLALPMTATNKKNGNKFAEQKARLTGIWQQCLPMTTNDGGRQIRFLPHFKILSSDGTFCNMSQANSVAPAALFATGEWRITSDSTFVEHLATNAKSVYEGKDNELTFRLPMGNQVLEVFYTMPGDTRRIREAWIRVQEGDAVAIAQKYFERLNGINSDGNNTPKKETSTPTKDSVLIVINGEQCCDITSDFIINGTYDDYEKFLNSRNLTLDRIDIWKNEKKKDQFRQKFGNWVKSVIEITARPTDRPTENPRGIYKLMSIKGGIQEINPYPHDVYKICTDRVTMRMTMMGGPNNMFRIDHSDPIVLNYTGEKTDLDRTADKSIRIFDSNDKHFTLKWWSTLPNSAYYPYNNWSYEYYESGKYSKAAQPIAEMLTSAPARDPNNPLIGTWQYVMKIDKMDGESKGNWIDELKKVDNMKDVLTYLRQSDPGEPKQFQVYTPSHFFIMRMLDNMKEMMGAFDNITYNGKESVTAPGGEVMEIHWLTDDFFAIKQRMGKKVLYRIWERVKDDQTMLNRIGSHFIQHKE